MLNHLNSVSVAARLPYFVTCTLPDEVYDSDRTSFAKTAKVWMDSFTKRLLRVCPEAAGFWRIEWQQRKSGRHEGEWFPHFHLLVWGLPDRQISPETAEAPERREAYVCVKDNQLTFELIRTLGSDCGGAMRCETEVDGERFVLTASPRVIGRCQNLLDRVQSVVLKHREECLGYSEEGTMGMQDWASLAWYHVVDSHNVDHLSAGVRVQAVRTWGGVMTYCAKYMAKQETGSLYEVPLGRTWGIFNRKAVPWAKMIELPLATEVGVALRRVARRYLEHRFGRRVKVPYGVTLYCDVERFRPLWRPSPDPDPF